MDWNNLLKENPAKKLKNIKNQSQNAACEQKPQSK